MLWRLIFVGGPLLCPLHLCQPKAFGREDAPDELGGGKDAALVLDVLEEVLLRPPSTQLDVMRARAIM